MEGVNPIQMLGQIFASVNPQTHNNLVTLLRESLQDSTKILQIEETIKVAVSS